MPRKSKPLTEEEQAHRDAIGIDLKKRDLEAQRTFEVQGFTWSYKSLMDAIPTQAIKDYLAIYRGWEP